MNSVFSQTGYVLKRQGLAIGGKYQLFEAQNDKPVLYIEDEYSTSSLGRVKTRIEAFLEMIA